MSYWRGDDDPYARQRSPPASRYDYRAEPPSRSPDYTRGAAPERGAPVYGRGARSPSPYAGYDRYRTSRSPYSSRYPAAPVDRDPYDRYDRYDREREVVGGAPPPRGYGDYDRERERDRDRYAAPEERYQRRPPPASGEEYYGGGGRDREPPPRRRPPVEEVGPIPDPLESPALLPFKQFAHVHRARQAALNPSSSSSDLSTQEMFNLYKQYKIVYTARSARRFWEEKRDLPFFLEKYGLGDVEVERRQSRRRQGRHGRKQKWLEELSSGAIDGVAFEQHFPSIAESKAAGAGSQDSTIFSRSGEPIKLTSDALPIDPCPEQLLVMRIPPECSRGAIEEELATMDGFRYLALGEAHANKAYFAIGWAQFETDQNAADARQKMMDSNVVQRYKLQLDLALRGVQVKFRSAPSGAGRLQRLATDLRQAKELVRWLEAEDREQLWPTGEESPPLDEAGRSANATDASAEIGRKVFEAMGMTRYYEADGSELEDDVLRSIADNERLLDSESFKAAVRSTIKKQLDLHLDLLREVYHCDYYSSTICDFSEELVRRARAHYRRMYPAGESEAEREGRQEAGGGTEESLNVGEEQWAENLDRKHALLLSLPSSDIAEHGGVDLDKLMLDLATPFARQDGEEKHRCVVQVVNPAHEKALAEGMAADEPGVPPPTKTCDKLFRALVFVQKHVCNKHRDIIEGELGEGRKADIKYLNNYIRDPTRIMPPLSGSLVAAVNEREARGAGGRPNGHGHGYSQSHNFMAATHSWDDPAGLSAGDGGRMGLIRMGPSTVVPGGGGRKRRRSHSPPPGLHRRDSRRGAPGGLEDRMAPPPLGGPPPIHLAPGMGAPPPLHLRLGGLVENGGGSNGFADPDAPALPAEPLPPAPRPLDPRAARGRDMRSYQDLDTSGGPGAGGDGAGEVMELEY
ncbi:hypothetical protein BDZ90DRAFT_226006 [Jaminaea rosea]|uniref:SERRATE/Ars2 N-terminal domain-containing protein n=1 Tax=Jaminaea rosea TaxID=1569628 RepID=A0A316V2V7_9BASI|nr:hypothetical protein BDZ90DRAFT_226006 [Jaminaea rosea]PWN29765.1 hypothetical protein BDZ90DRAFT_226006 [Jaminaea rosea]